MPAGLELAIEALKSHRRGGHSQRLSAWRAEAHTSWDGQKAVSLRITDWSIFIKKNRTLLENTVSMDTVL